MKGKTDDIPMSSQHLEDVCSELSKEKLRLIQIKCILDLLYLRANLCKENTNTKSVSAALHQPNRFFTGCSKCTINITTVNTTYNGTFTRNSDAQDK